MQLRVQKVRKLILSHAYCAVLFKAFMNWYHAYVHLCCNTVLDFLLKCWSHGGVTSLLARHCEGVLDHKERQSEYDNSKMAWLGEKYSLAKPVRGERKRLVRARSCKWRIVPDMRFLQFFFFIKINRAFCITLTWANSLTCYKPMFKYVG